MSEPKKRRGGKHRPGLLVLRPARDDQAEEWREAAARAGMTLAAWVREACDDKARRGDGSHG